MLCLALPITKLESSDLLCHAYISLKFKTYYDMCLLKVYICQVVQSFAGLIAKFMYVDNGGLFGEQP